MAETMIERMSRAVEDRSINDSARTEIAIRQAEGKRLAYKEPAGG